MSKDTSKIVEELGLCADFKAFYDENKDYMVRESLAELLQRFLAEKNLSKAQVIRRSELSEVYAYQIFSGLRVPERNKLLCLSVAMELSLEATQRLLRCAGYSPLYVKLPFDSVLLYGICNHLTVMQINELLYEYGFETIG